jgi:hypothetical protein
VNTKQKTVPCSLLPVPYPESPLYLHSFVFKNEVTNEIWTDLQKVVIIELPKVPKDDKDDDTNSNYELLQCFGLKSTEEFRMFALRHPKVKPVCDTVIRLNLIKSLRMIAESREKYKRDMAGIKDYAWEAGRAEAKAEAKAEYDVIIKEKDAALSEKDAALSEKDAALSEQVAENARLLAEIERLKKG